MARKRVVFISLIVCVAILGIRFFYTLFWQKINKNIIFATEHSQVINIDGTTIEERFLVPEGFVRVEAEAGSYAEFLRQLPLKPDGSFVYYYDGSKKNNQQTYLAVINMEIGDRNLQQCADTVLRYLAEYLWQADKKENIQFYFTSGFLCKWSEYSEGYRAEISNNVVKWEKTAADAANGATFWQYLQLVFSYAGTLSLEAYETEPVAITDMQIGDMFLQGGNPGHVVQVADMAINSATGGKCFLLVQGYMPAQDGHVLCGRGDGALGPWYFLPAAASGKFVTPEYTFEYTQLRRFKNLP